MFNPFKKKKLNLREIHKLYILLKDSLPEKQEEYLMNEILYIMENISVEKFRDSINILYPKLKTKNSLQIAQLFITGLSKNSFFEYVFFAKGLDPSGKR